MGLHAVGMRLKVSMRSPRGEQQCGRGSPPTRMGASTRHRFPRARHPFFNARALRCPSSRSSCSLCFKYAAEAPRVVEPKATRMITLRSLLRVSVPLWFYAQGRDLSRCYAASSPSAGLVSTRRTMTKTVASPSISNTAKRRKLPHCGTMVAWNCEVAGSR